MSDKNNEIAIIKKYANRRLYNTQISSYITLDDLFDMIKRHEEFQVVDAKTNEDITRQILTQIIFDQEAKGYSLLPISFLKNLITLYGSGTGNPIASTYLDATMENFMKNQPYFASGMDELNPIKVFERITQQNMEIFNKTMGMFTPKN